MWKLCDPLSLVSKLNCQAAPELHSLARPFSLLYPMPLNHELLSSGCQSPAPPCPGWALTSSGSFASLGFFSPWRPPVLTLSPEDDALWAPGASSPRALSPPECGPANSHSRCLAVCSPEGGPCALRSLPWALGSLQEGAERLQSSTSQGAQALSVCLVS